MNVRGIGVAFAAVLAMACRSTGSQAEASGTAQAPPADTYGTSGTAQAPSAGGPAGQDPLVVPGPAIKGHASDQVVSGEIGSVSQSSLTISSSAGDSKTLEIAPETSITVEGRDASVSDLQEGQRVRASFNQAEGRDVAVEIEVVGERSSSASSAPSGGQGAASPSDVSGSSPPSGAEGSTSSGASGSTASSAQGTTGGQDPLVEPGPAIKGHASDQVVSGKIEEVSGSSLKISSQLGDQKVLEIAPETSITIDGMDASASDLEEGQEVRASYNQAEGQDVAVAIEAGKESASGEPKELGASPGSSSDVGASGTGSSGSAEPASPSGTGSSGSASEPASPTGSSPR